MSQTAFVLILALDEASGEATHDLIRERFGHACRVVTSVPDAVDSIRARTPDVVVAIDPPDGQAALQTLLRTLDDCQSDATLLAVGRTAPPEPSEESQVVIRHSERPEDEASLAALIGQAASRAATRHDARRLKEQLSSQPIDDFQGIVGVSKPIQRIIERIRKAARNKLTVLILGETGTGKDLIARAIHNCSDRAEKPFGVLNCAGLSETLIESELFGHVKGAFTGATTDRKGHFAAADGGTLFLDEIGDMPIAMQAKLLRVLEYREFTPVGTTDLRRVDVRVIAATNAELEDKIREKEFREDLYYRLNQWRIEVPPLRDRTEDIPLLAMHFLRKINADNDLAVESFSSDALKLLASHHWPGNIRELQNTILSTACEVEDRSIEASDLPEKLQGTRALVPTTGLVGKSWQEVEKELIALTLAANSGNREQAAKMLGMGTRTLYRKIKEYDL